jgi:type IV secretion system protein VirB9
MTRLIPLLLAMTASTPAMAGDARVVVKLYDPATVVSLNGRPGWQSTVVFADDERIENVGLGDSATWQVTPNKRANLLFLKPTDAHARTNMTVVTNRHLYMFELSSTAALPVYLLRFTYPAAAAMVPHAAATPPPPPPPVAKTDPSALHFNWRASGNRRVLPLEHYDDGHQMFLSWKPDVPLPAILVTGADGVEGPANSAIRGNTLVIDGVPARIVLRSGRDQAVLEPDAPASRER